MSKTAREALLSLAAEFDRLEAGTITEEAAHHANGDDDAGAMASAAGDAWRGAAARARAHARSATSGGNEGASFVPGGSHPAGIPVQWGTPRDHAACDDAIQAARALGAQDALLSLAARFDRHAGEAFAVAATWPGTAATGTADLATAVGGAYQAAARTARQRAGSGPGAPSATSPAPEDPDLALAGLSPAEAYGAGVKAERERIRELADRNGAVCTGDEGTSCYFSALIREQP